MGKRAIIFLVVTLLSLEVQAATKERKLIGVFYLQSPFAHVHSSPSRYSHSLTTLSCGHPIKVYENKSIATGWREVAVANYQGFIRSSELAAGKVECWQDRYSRFFSGLNLEISDIYYWGKLYDQYLGARVGME